MSGEKLPKGQELYAEPFPLQDAEAIGLEDAESMYVLLPFLGLPTRPCPELQIAVDALQLHCSQLPTPSLVALS